MGLKCHLDTGKQKFLMSLYFDKNAQTPQNDTVNSWRVKQDHRSLSFYFFVCPCAVCLPVCLRSLGHSFDHTNLFIHI